SNRLKRLIEDILLLSFIENKDNALVDSICIYEVFIEIYDLTSYISKSKNINLTYEFSDKNIRVLSNRDYIKQVFLNLIDNAIKYTPENKDVHIKVSLQNNKILISVKDTGVGIPEEDIERIFERFYRVDKARSRDVGGTGLGLAITKHIVKSLGGSIDVKSELGKGSEFIVAVPQKNFL
ncbi:MAG: sensor histidine kinase, partial [Romboutsia sp.]|uniref:sensor histidine kinase n=1 Tax=Romboutsia sp. TaxID=1965302 RepID=UPI003F305C70